MEPTDTAEAGSPAELLAMPPEPEWDDSMSLRETLSYLIWEMKGRVSHWFGRHSFVDNERWSSDGPITVIAVSEQICWFCHAKQTVTPIRTETFRR